DSRIAKAPGPVGRYVHHAHQDSTPGGPGREPHPPIGGAVPSESEGRHLLPGASPAHELVRPAGVRRPRGLGPRQPGSHRLRGSRAVGRPAVHLRARRPPPLLALQPFPVGRRGRHRAPDRTGLGRRLGHRGGRPARSPRGGRSGQAQDGEASVAPRRL
ncbi:MAG: hypothetical protein AVDCRST_MAG10-875, partial [uncultured Acidimicrobiales bacterium]